MSELEIQGRTNSANFDAHMAEARSVGEYLAKHVQHIAVPHPEVRPDIGNVQINFGFEHVGATKHYPLVQLYFFIANNREVTWNVLLHDFRADPHGYVRHMLERMGEMMRNTMRLRAKKKAATVAINDALMRAARNG